MLNLTADNISKTNTPINLKLIILNVKLFIHNLINDYFLIIDIDNMKIKTTNTLFKTLFQFVRSLRFYS